MRTSYKRDPPLYAWLVVAIPVFGLVVRMQMAISEATYADWLTYVRGVDAIWTGNSPYAPFQLNGPYLLSAAAEGQGYVYPPSAAVLMAPIIRPFEVWTALSLAVFAIGLLAVARRHGALRALPTFIILSIAIPATPLWDGLVGGAASPMLAGMLGLVYGGLPLAGVGAAIKLFPASWVLLDTSRTSLVWTCIGIGIPTVVALALAGLRPWLEFVPVFVNMEPDCSMFVSLVCSGLPSAVAYVLAPVTLIVGWNFGRVWLLLALGVASLMIAPQLPLHYAVLLGPGIVAVGCIAISWTGDRLHPMSPATE